MSPRQGIWRGFQRGQPESRAEEAVPGWLEKGNTDMVPNASGS